MNYKKNPEANICIVNKGADLSQPGWAHQISQSAGLIVHHLTRFYRILA